MMFSGWLICLLLVIAALFSFLGGGHILSPWYNALSDKEKEEYSKAKVCIQTGINFSVFALSLALFLLFLNVNISDLIKITISIIFLMFIVAYIVLLSKKGLKKCKKQSNQGDN